MDNGYGIYLWWSSSNMLQNNNASDNYVGICMDYSSDNTLTNNIANSNNEHGIGIWRPCANNILRSNTASNNGIGICLNYNVGNTTLYHNNLINNTQYNAWDTGYTNNQWDSGSEGNYYGDDYTGTDSDGDGIGDTPYGISGYSGNGDRYPLMFPYNEQLHETRKEVYSISTSTTNIFQVDDDIIDQISTENPDPKVANEKLRACVVSEKEDSSTAAVLDAAETEQQRTDIQNIIDDNSGDFEQTTEEINDYVETSVSDPLGLWDRAKEKFFSTRLPKNTIIDINAANAVTRVFGEFSGAFKKFFWAGKAVTVVNDLQTEQELEQRLDGPAVPSDVSNNLKAVSRISRVITQLDPTTYFSTTINGDLGMLIKVTVKLSKQRVWIPDHYNEEWEYIWDQVEGEVALYGMENVYLDNNGGYARVYWNPSDEDIHYYIHLQGEPKTNFWGKLFGSRETGRWREVEEQYDGTWRIISVSGSSSSSLPKALTFSLGKVTTAAQTSRDTDPIKIYDIFTQDLDNDGYADIIGFDTTGDGKPDINMTDLNNDSLIDLWEFEDNGTKITGYDITGDGTSDVYDTNEDGAIDVWDLDGDGSPDQMDADYDGRVDAYDTDYNGALDTFVEFDHEIVAWIDSLSYGETFLQNDSVMLNGSVYNGTNEAVPPYNFTWTSDIDGIIGTGNNITYFNLSVGDHIITLTVQDSNGSTGNDTVQITITQKGDLNITSFAPSTPVTDTEGATRTFSITVNQTANVSWLINGTEAQINESVTSASYTNTSAAPGIWNVSAIATNANGTAMQTWVWIVSASVETATITSWSNDKTNNDSLHITLNESESVRFNATANQTITAWNWLKDGAAQSNTSDNYTTSWSVNGTYAVSVNATNANGTSDTKTWAVTVNEAEPSPCYIATATYGTPLDSRIDILRDFRDELLLTNPIGKTFVSTYYRTSPPIADALRANDGLRTVTRLTLITPLVYLSKFLLNGILAIGIFIIGSAAVLSLRKERMKMLRPLLVGTGSILVFIAAIFSLGFVGYTIPFCATVGAYMLPFVIPLSVVFMLCMVLKMRANVSDNIKKHVWNSKV